MSEFGMQSIAEIIVHQKLAHNASLPVSTQTRQKRLQNIINILVDHKASLTQAMDEDFGGRDQTFSLMNDILGSVLSLDHARKKVSLWNRPSKRPTLIPFSWFGAKGEVRYYPNGIIGILGAWNAPLFTLFAPLSSTLAAGNRAILKPSETVPRTASLLAKIFSENIDPDIVSIVTGGPEVGADFCAQPFDQIIFTGSAEIGKKVLAAAAPNLTPVILELGGKSPVIISRTADLADAANKIALGKGSNAGQICISPDTVYVPKDLSVKFTEQLAQAYEKFYGTESMTTSIINTRHHKRLIETLSDASKSGAITKKTGCLEGQGRREALSIVVNADPGSRIRNEEIFGPAVNLLPYENLCDVISDIKSRPEPLALYYFGKNKHEEQFVFDNLISGGAGTNDVMMHAAMNDAPFGGFGGSGMGSYHGKEGFNALSHARTHYRAGWWDPREKFGMLPPYSEKLKTMVEKTAQKYRRDT